MSDDYKSAIVRVGDGRGFLVRTRHKRDQILTAAHCLPDLPHAEYDFASQADFGLYGNLVGSLDDTPAITVRCIYVDPCSDLAVLAEPDHQSFADEWHDYADFINDRSHLRVGICRDEQPGKMLNCQGDWVDCVVSPSGWQGSTLEVSGIVPDDYLPGMSGSPILDEQFCALGVVSSGSRLNPSLAMRLPLEQVAELMGASVVDALRFRVGRDDARIETKRQLLQNLVGQKGNSE